MNKSTSLQRRAASIEKLSAFETMLARPRVIRSQEGTDKLRAKVIALRAELSHA